MDLIMVSFGMMLGLAFMCLLGASGVIKKSPSDLPYIVILPVGVITALTLFGFGLHRLF